VGSCACSPEAFELDAVEAVCTGDIAGDEMVDWCRSGRQIDRRSSRGGNGGAVSAIGKYP